VDWAGTGALYRHGEALLPKIVHRPARGARAAFLAVAVVTTLGLAQTVAAAGPLGAQVPAAKGKGVIGSTSSTIALTGFGFGHGHGMGQWGAYGYASVYGWSYQQILAHYYGGTRLGPLPSPEPEVTVDLTELDNRSPIASALPGRQLVVTWPGGGSLSAPAVEVTRSGGALVVSSGPGCAGPWRAVTTATAAVTVASAGPAGPVDGSSTTPPAAGLSGSELTACLPGTGQRVYQGALVVGLSGQTENVLPLEDYVDGVVAAESPPVWANMGGEAALEAQAVAARSVAVALVAASGAICDTTSCQVYKGLPDQYGMTADGAVRATAGEVLYCEAGSSCGPAGSVAVTEYSSSTGGYTAGGAFPAVADLGDSVSANPVHTWSALIPLAKLEATFPSVGAVEQVQVTQRNGLGQIGGRVDELKVVGDAGAVNLTGDQFAADFNLYSDWFAVAGAPPASTTSITTTMPGTTTGTNGATNSGAATSGAATNGAATKRAGPTTSTSGGKQKSSPIGGSPLRLGNGYWVVNSNGYVAAFGAATSYGTAAGTSLEGIVTSMAATPDNRGYWLLGSNGGVLAFGDASWYGSASKLHLAKRVIGMAPTPNGRGYWLVASDGGIFAYGNAHFYGSTGGEALQKPIVNIAATPDGHGYWLVSSDGGIFAFGDARFYGSADTIHLKKKIVGIVPSADGRGYFLVGKDGGVFAFGDARFLGSLPGKQIAAKVAAVTPTNNGRGYYVVATNGRVFAFGAATPARQLEGAGLSLAGAVAIVGYRLPG
jgi:SpoIID/LytB domain protein